MPDQVTTQVNKAVSNDSKATKQFADQEKEKIFEHKGQKERSRVTYGLEDGDLPAGEVVEGEVVTIKRKLETARDFQGGSGKKKVKQWY